MFSDQMLPCILRINVLSLDDFSNDVIETLDTFKFKLLQLLVCNVAKKYTNI